MKYFKKLVATVTAIALALSMGAAAAFAADETTGSITINDAVIDQTYTVYQILDLESYNASSGAYAYKAANGWSDFLNSEDIKGVYVNVDVQGYVTWVENASAADFAKLAQAYAKATTPSAEPVTAVSSTVKFEGLDLGYYLVDTTLGTICSLDTTNPNVEMTEKNEAPAVTKEVQEDSSNAWGETNDADINQVVNYKATVTVQAGAENYILHDTMSAGLTYNGVTSVKIGDNHVAAANYTVTAPGACGCTFEVKFNNDYIASLEAGTEIVVSYSATLNENAVVGLPGNPNEVKLQYGDNSEPSYTPADKTITYTWDTKVIKFTKNNNENLMLAGATFKLSTDQAGNNAIKFHDLGENKYEVCADSACGKGHVTEITTDSTGAFNIEGLDSGTYYLTETAAPAGYNKLSGPVEVTITGATTGDDGNLTYSTVETWVENKSGTELPSTGGMGTTILYAVGAILVLGAGIALVVKRRMAASK